MKTEITKCERHIADKQCKEYRYVITGYNTAALAFVKNTVMIGSSYNDVYQCTREAGHDGTHQWPM